MALIADLVQETTTTSGTVLNIALSSVAGYARFSDAFTTDDVVYYAIEDGNNREVGIGTVKAGNTLDRTTPLVTLVSGVYDDTTPARISLSGSVADVFCGPVTDVLSGGSFDAVFNALTSGAIKAASDSTYDIGENTTRFANGYFDTLHSNSIGIDVISVSETWAAPKASYIYDTARDYDGGAWRNQTTGLSWHEEAVPAGSYLGVYANETAARAAGGGTGDWYARTTGPTFFELSAGSGETQIYRAGSAEFPARVAIVAWAGVTSSIVIFDLTQPDAPMWMVFDGDGVGKSVYRNGTTSSSLVMLNGLLLEGMNGTLGALNRIDFINDNTLIQVNTTSAVYFHDTIAVRNTAVTTSITGYFTAGLVNRQINDVAITALPTAPLDANGMPVPTIAVATGSGIAGGCSVITDDGNVWDIGSATSPWKQVSFVGNEIAGSYSVGGSSVPYLAFGPIPTADIAVISNWYTDWYEIYPYGSADLYLHSGDATNSTLLKAFDTTNNVIAVAPQRSSAKRFSYLVRDTTTPANGMVCAIGTDYTTGYLPGAVKGAWLSDTTAETIGVDESTDLITAADDSTFASDTGNWSLGTGWSITGGVLTKSAGTGSTATLSNSYYSTLTVGKPYKVVFTVTNRTAGAIDLRFGQANSPKVQSITANQSYEYELVYNQDISLSFFADASFDGDIDDVYIYETGNLIGPGTVFANTELSYWTGANATLSIQGSYPDSTYLRLTADANGEMYAYQSFTTVVGKSYVVQVETVAETVTGVLDVHVGTAANGVQNLHEVITTVGSYTFTFEATATTTYLTLNADSSTLLGETADFDNISVRLAVADRSVNDNGLEVHGQITKAAVATGAELMAYNGFAADDYLEQPYNADLNYGTGDFYWMGWFKKNGSGRHILLDRANGTDNTNRVKISVSVGTADITLGTYDSTPTLTNYSFGTNSIREDDTWVFFVIIRNSDGSADLYVDGEFVTNVAGTVRDVSNTGGTHVTRFGIETDSASFPWNTGSITMLRTGAYAPTAAQIAEIYNKERMLFQPNAACTLAGTSDAVLDMDYNEITDELAVITSYGRSTFRGLERVDSEATGVGTPATIAVHDKVIVQGGSTHTQIDDAKLDVKAELAALKLDQEQFVKDVDLIGDGTNSVTLGPTSLAYETNNIAIGTNAQSGQNAGGLTETGAIAIGASAIAYETEGVAIGVGAVTGQSGTTADPRSIAIGLNALADQSASISIGRESDGRGTGAVALGNVSQALEDQCIAIGVLTQAGQSAGGAVEIDAIAIGYAAKAYETSGISIGDGAISGVNLATASPNAIAIGTSADATASGSTAVGNAAQGTGANSTAIGNIAQATGSNAASLGTNAQATAANTTALGPAAFAYETGGVAIGISAQAGQSSGGTTEIDAIAIGNAAKAYETSGIAIGDGAVTGRSGTSIDPDSIAIGRAALADEVGAVAIGAASDCGASQGVALGYGADAREVYSIAIGYLAQSGQTSNGATELYAISIGGNAKAYESYGIAIGSGAVTGRSGTSIDPDSIAIGRAALADEGGAVAIGTNSDCGAGYGVALGQQADAREFYSIAIGYLAQSGQTSNGATETDAIAIGNAAKAYETSGIAIGDGAVTGQSGTSTDPDSIAIGRAALADQQGSISIGALSDANGTESIAIGDSSQATGDYSIALGERAVSSGTGSICIGYQVATSTATNSLAVGTSSDATADNAIAIGYLTQGNGASSTAIGQNAQAKEQYTLAVGWGAVAGQNAGATAEPGAVAIGTSSGTACAAYETNCTAIGNAAQAGVSGTSTDPGGTAVGASSRANKTYATAVGYGCNQGVTAGSYSTAIGANVNATGDYSFGGAENAQPKEQYCIAIGWNTVAGQSENGSTETGAIAIGQSADAYETNGIAIGTNARSGVSGTSVDPDSIAIGNNAFATAANSIAIGAGTDATIDNAVAIGHDVQATTAEEVHIGTSNTNKMVLDSSGNLSLVTSTGNLVLASGNGIDFSATSDASGMASELFDDYEEGTFTPTIQDNDNSDAESQTYTTQAGNYVKIGNHVFCSVRLSVTSTGTLTGANAARIAGLPFTSASSTGNQVGGAITYMAGVSFAANEIPVGTTHVQAGTSYAVMPKWADVSSATTANIYVSIDDLTTAFDLYCDFHYQV